MNVSMQDPNKVVAILVAVFQMSMNEIRISPNEDTNIDPIIDHPIVR